MWTSSPQTYLRTNNENDDRCQAQCPKESFFIPSPYNIIYRSGKILADKVLTKIPGFISNINLCWHLTLPQALTGADRLNWLSPSWLVQHVGQIRCSYQQSAVASGLWFPGHLVNPCFGWMTDFFQELFLKQGQCITSNLSTTIQQYNISIDHEIYTQLYTHTIMNINDMCIYTYIYVYICIYIYMYIYILMHINKYIMNSYDIPWEKKTAPASARPNWDWAARSPVQWRRLGSTAGGERNGFPGGKSMATMWGPQDS